MIYLVRFFLIISIVLTAFKAYCLSETLFLFDSEIASGYYNSNEQDEGKFGLNLDLSPSLFFKVSDNNNFFSNYSISYEETNQVIEEEGIRWTDQLLGNTIIMGWIHKPEGENSSFQNKLSLFGYYEFTKGTDDENLNTGLYNFWDLGLKDEIRYLTSLKSKPLIITAGYKFYFRRFPNYEGLYYSIYGVGPQWEKDYFGNRLWTGAELSCNDKISINTELSYLLKLYNDDLVQQEPINVGDDPYTSDKRREYVISFVLGCNYKVYDKLSIKFSITPELRRGNQNYYDTSQLTFIKNVYDYNLYDISVNFLMKPYQKLFCQLGYEFIYKKYTNNLAFNEQGNYKNEKLNKLDHIILLNLIYPVYNNIDIVASGFYDFSKSNTEYERDYGYNYESSNFGLGIKYKY